MMKTKIFCSILCVVMLISTLLLPANANKVDLTSETVSWETDSCFRMQTSEQYPTAAHTRTQLFTDTVTVDSTITLWYKPDAATAAVQNSFPIEITNVSQWKAQKLDAVDVLASVEMYLYDAFYIDPVAKTTASGCTLKLPIENATKINMNVGEWNRIDMLVDFTNNTMTAYLNYTSLGSMTMANTENGYCGINFRSNQANKPVKVAYLDNLMIRTGCNTPVKGDIASNASVATVKAAKDQILYFDSFDTMNFAQSGAGSCYNAQAVNVSLTTGGLIPQKAGGDFRGVQFSAVSENKYNVRLVSTIDTYKNYKSVGYDIEYSGKTKTVTCAYVYDMITASTTSGITSKYLATGFGAGNIYAVTITDVPTGSNYTFKVTPFTSDQQGTKVSGSPVTITCCDGAIVEN